MMSTSRLGHIYIMELIQCQALTKDIYCVHIGPLYVVSHMRNWLLENFRNICGEQLFWYLHVYMFIDYKGCYIPLLL